MFFKPVMQGGLKSLTGGMKSSFHRSKNKGFVLADIASRGPRNDKIGPLVPLRVHSVGTLRQTTPVPSARSSCVNVSASKRRYRNILLRGITFYRKKLCFWTDENWISSPLLSFLTRPA